MMKFELVLKALSRSKSFSVIFIANFILAILALFFLQFFKGSIESSLESKSKGLLGADIVVSSRFLITEDQKEALHVAQAANDKETVRAIFSEVGIDLPEKHQVRKMR